MCSKRTETDVTATLRRGRIYWAKLDKRRPVLVVSPDYRNEHSFSAIVIPVSSALSIAPTHVRLRKGEGGIRKASVAKCENIMTLRKLDIDSKSLGSALNAKKMLLVEHAILRAIGVPIGM